MKRTTEIIDLPKNLLEKLPVSDKSRCRGKRMTTGVSHADILLDNLVRLNQRLLSLDAVDLDGLREVLDHRSRLMTQAGSLLRSDTDFTKRDMAYFRAALDQALEVGETAVHRLLSMRETVKQLTV